MFAPKTSNVMMTEIKCGIEEKITRRPDNLSVGTVIKEI